MNSMEAIALTRTHFERLAQEPVSRNLVILLSELMTRADCSGIVRCRLELLAGPIGITTKEVRNNLVRLERAGVIQRKNGPRQELEVQFQDGTMLNGD